MSAPEKPSRAEAEALCPFQPLEKYERPLMPAQQSVRLFFTRLWQMLRRAEGGPFVAEAQLKGTRLRKLDAVAAPPSCGPLLDELELTVADWVAAGSPTPRTRLFVLPPCDDFGVIEAWAENKGHPVLEAPTRDSLVSAAPPVVPELDAEGVIVIPRLERWFLRHRNGLTLVRSLLAAIEARRGHCLVGCNSWAWAFLKHTLGANLLMPEPLIFQRFDGPRLRRWFTELAEAEAGTAFRLSRNGADVLAADAKGKPEDDYLEKLGAQSLGIPWVAWRMWRASLRTDEEEKRENGDKKKAGGPGERTLWVMDAPELSLPADHQQNALLVLHALLIHDRLTAEELSQVLPVVGETFIVAALDAAGFVEQTGPEIRCRALAYPAIRRELFAAGFPTD